jgi:hypothetical protein
LYQVRGEAARSLVIEPELFRKWEDDPATMKGVAAAAGKLRDLNEND